MSNLENNAYICKQCGEEDETCWVSSCEVCDKEGSVCCIRPVFITKVGNGQDVDMYFCKECCKQFFDIFFEPRLLPSHAPDLSMLNKDKKEILIKKQKDGIRRILAAINKEVKKNG